tara:strand:- start:576510 stop:577223 length:714 start_codon:yes stop_codon:yes gene_type:complete
MRNSFNTTQTLEELSIKLQQVEEHLRSPVFTRGMVLSLVFSVASQGAKELTDDYLNAISYLSDIRAGIESRDLKAVNVGCQWLQRLSSNVFHRREPMPLSVLSEKQDRLRAALSYASGEISSFNDSSILKLKEGSQRIFRNGLFVEQCEGDMRHFDFERRVLTGWYYDNSENKEFPFSKANIWELDEMISMVRVLRRCFPSEALDGAYAELAHLRVTYEERVTLVEEQNSYLQRLTA